MTEKNRTGMTGTRKLRLQRTFALCVILVMAVANYVAPWLY